MMIYKRLRRRIGGKVLDRGPMEARQLGALIGRDYPSVELKVGEHGVHLSFLEVLEALDQIPARRLVAALGVEGAERLSGQLERVRRHLERVEE